MERFLLDSSTILNILAGNANGQKAVGILKNNEACTSIICCCEVLNKINLEKYAKAEAFLSKLLSFSLTHSDGETAKGIQKNCRKNGKHVPTIDCLIAATAINNDAIMISSDSDFQRIDEARKRLMP